MSNPKKKAGARGEKIPQPRLEVLLAAAAAARAHAYAPYSKFRVGAAVLTARGKVYFGCNVENASYGLSLCAERAAIAAAVAAGEKRMVAIAVVSGSREPAPPCGMCLQTLLELGGTDLNVTLSGPRGRRRQYALGELMPHAFGRTFL